MTEPKNSSVIEHLRKKVAVMIHPGAQDEPVNSGIPVSRSRFIERGSVMTREDAASRLRSRIDNTLRKGNL